MARQKMRLRNWIQILFALIVLYIGIKFIFFVDQYLTPGTIPTLAHPSGVEGFLPISALVSLKAWLTTGVFDSIHPAGLVILLTVILLSFLFKKAFCAWLCPIGTLSEGLARLGRFFFGRNFKLPKFLDYPLRSIKYLLMLFFLSTILLGMSGSAAAAFLKTPYNMVADVKMLQFFQGLTGTSLVIVGLLLILSMVIDSFWCRYLCPYGALLGLISLISPFRITRDEVSCINCHACNQVCPNSIAVAKAKRVWSPECNGCLNCVEVCPVPKTLQFKASLAKWVFTPRTLAMAVVGFWIVVVLLAKLSGHWQTVITPQMYHVLIPEASSLSH